MRNLDISNQMPRLADSESRQIVPSSRITKPMRSSGPKVKELLTNSVLQVPGQAGSKADIMAMAETLHPELASDKQLQRSLDNAFSKYLEVSPLRVMLLHTDNDDHESSIAEDQAFCLKSAVVSCLKSPEAQACSNSLDFDTLMKMLVDRHGA